jgi:hypothetical protein
MAAVILDFDKFRLARKRARNEARLQAEYYDALRVCMKLGEHYCDRLRAAGWKEGESSADIIGPELLAESLMLASEAALQRWPGPMPDASA